MAETTEPTRSLAIGPYLFPLSGGGVRSLRAGRTFWQMLEEHGVRSSVIRMPANFPPAECEAESLAGMGTPDMTGSFGTFSFYTADPSEKRDKVPGGQIVRVALRNGRAELAIPGPPNQMRRDHQATSVTPDGRRRSLGTGRPLRYAGARSSFFATGGMVGIGCARSIP